MSMSEREMALVLKRGIGSFGARQKRHEDKLLARILDEVDFGNTFVDDEDDFGRGISDDELELLAAAGNLNAILNDERNDL